MRLSVILCVIAAAMTATRGTAAEARLLLRGRVNFPGNLPAYSEDNVNFYGTNVYLLGSAFLRYRAEEILGHPPPADLKIAAERVANTSVILVKAASTDERAAASFLGALVDEFLKFKREQKKQAFLNAMTRLDAALKAASDEAAPELQKMKQQLTAASVLDADPEFEKLSEK